MSGAVGYRNQSYLEDVMETARQAFRHLDGGVWDFRDSLGRSDRDLYIQSCLGNLQSAILEIESLIEIIDQPDQLARIDRDILLEHLGRTD